MAVTRAEVLNELLVLLEAQVPYLTRPCAFKVSREGVIQALEAL
jgi:hypothetical protein